MAQKKLLLYKFTLYPHCRKRSVLHAALRKEVLSTIAHGAFVSLLLAIQDKLHSKKKKKIGGGGRWRGRRGAFLSSLSLRVIVNLIIINRTQRVSSNSPKEPAISVLPMEHPNGYIQMMFASPLHSTPDSQNNSLYKNKNLVYHQQWAESISPKLARVFIIHILRWVLKDWQHLFCYETHQSKLLLSKHISMCKMIVYQFNPW